MLQAGDSKISHVSAEEYAANPYLGYNGISLHLPLPRAYFKKLFSC